MNLTKKQRETVDQLSARGYTVVRQMDDMDANWEGQTPDVVMESPGGDRSVDVDAHGKIRGKTLS